MDYTVTHIKPFGLCIEAKDPSTSIKEIDIDALRRAHSEEPLMVLRGFKTFNNSSEFADYCDTWGEVSIWPFGKVLELKEHNNPEDHIFDSSYIPLHWDGMYRPHVPEYQIFHCMIPPLQKHGGRTIFSNTVTALSDISPQLRSLLNKTTGIYQRKMAFYESKTLSPIIMKHPQHDYSVIRYNEPHTGDNGRLINPPKQHFIGVQKDQLNHLHHHLKKILYSDKHCYAHVWQAQDVVIANNFTLLHGREAFTTQSPRYIQRVHIESEPPFINPGLESYQ